MRPCPEQAARLAINRTLTWTPVQHTTVKPILCIAVLLLAGGAACHVQAQVPVQDGAAGDAGTHGAYLSLEFGDGRIHGSTQGDSGGSRSMGWRSLEVRAGREQTTAFGQGRIDFVHYNEGHPDNNHRDGFALQWVAVQALGGTFTGELGAGPYLSMNTTTVGGQEFDDAHWGLLLGGALRLPLRMLPAGTHLRLGVNYAWMPGAHRSAAILLGLGRQFGPARPDPGTSSASGPWWFGASLGRSITNLSHTKGANAGILEARKYLDGRFDHWAVSGKLVWEGDDGRRVDRDGIAAQLDYVQQVTPRFAVSAGIGPYLARNDRDEDQKTRANLLISLQAERALSHATRAFVNFNRVKTFRQTNDRDLLQLGLLKRF